MINLRERYVGDPPVKYSPRVLVSTLLESWPIESGMPGGVFNWSYVIEWVLNEDIETAGGIDWELGSSCQVLCDFRFLRV